MKRIKKFLIFTFLLISFIYIFPRIGLYSLIFDHATYDKISNNPEEIVSDINQLSPHTKNLALKFLERCYEENLNVKISETYRSQERQNYLYEKGRSRPGLIVTWTKNSKHTERRAFDIVKAGNKPYGDDDFFRKCADIGLELGLTPGYYFENYQDKPHFEFNAWWLP